MDIRVNDRLTDITTNYPPQTFDFSTTEPIVFNVYFYILIPTDGSYISSLTETNILDYVAKLNKAFNPFKIFFKYRGYKKYSEIVNGEEIAFANYSSVFNRINQIKNSNYINIVSCDVNYCPLDIGGVSIMDKLILIRACNFNAPYITYQMGRLLGLFKTQRGTNLSLTNYMINPNPCDDPTYPIHDNKLFQPTFSGNPGGTIENVTRDPNNPNYNANIAGDYVADTPAAFQGSEDNYCHTFLTSVPNSTFDYVSHPSIVDNSSEHLMYENIDILNFMSLTWDPPYKPCHFTHGQGVRIRQTIANTYFNYNQVQTSVQSLYQPYKTICDNSGDEPVGDNVLLRSGLSFKIKRPDVPNTKCLHYFQPGFDYEVSFCNPYTIPPTIGDLINSYDTSVIPTYTSYGTSINIAQLDTFNEDNCVEWPNQINYNIVGGKVIEMLPNTYNIDEKTETEINDPNLLLDIPAGLNTIIIQTDSGQSAQKTILK